MNQSIKPTPSVAEHIRVRPGTSCLLHPVYIMHHRELLELAALLGTHAKTIIHTGKGLSDNAIGDYWSASKFRHERWTRTLSKYSQDVQNANPDPRHHSWIRVRPVLEEILTSEVLTRIWTATVAAYDQIQAKHDLEPVTHSVFMGHLEARSQALNLMVYGQGFGVEEAVRLNRLRRRAERWTDLLLGQLYDAIDLKPFAFDLDRCQNFTEDIRSNGAGRGQYAWELVVGSMRAAFESGLSAASPNSDLNQRISESIIACLPDDVFRATGLLKPPWMIRMEAITEDTQVMIDQYLATHESSDGSDSSAVGRFSSRQPRR